jgi:hypothetical protein
MFILNKILFIYRSCLANYTLTNLFKKTKRMIANLEFSPAIVMVMLFVVAALVGGINAALTQGYLNPVQASSLSGIETILFLGYDATDGDTIVYHDGLISYPQAYWHGDQSLDGLNRGERIGVYVQNSSAEKITFKYIKLDGIDYSYQYMGPNNQMTPYSMDAPLNNGEFTIVTNGNHNAPADTIVEGSPELIPGQKATIILELEQTINTDRDMDFRITTNKGGVFVYTISPGQWSG